MLRKLLRAEVRKRMQDLFRHALVPCPDDMTPKERDELTELNLSVMEEVFAEFVSVKRQEVTAKKAA